MLSTYVSLNLKKWSEATTVLDLHLLYADSQLYVFSDTSFHTYTSKYFPKIGALRFCVAPQTQSSIRPLLSGETITLAGLFTRRLGDLAWLIRSPVGSLLMGSRDSEARGWGGLTGFQCRETTRPTEQRGKGVGGKHIKTFVPSFSYLPRLADWLLPSWMLMSKRGFWSSPRRNWFYFPQKIILPSRTGATKREMKAGFNSCEGGGEKSFFASQQPVDPISQHSRTNVMKERLPWLYDPLSLTPSSQMKYSFPLCAKINNKLITALAENPPNS